MQMMMGQKMVGAAVQNMPPPGGNQFQFFPIQVGGPTPYVRSRKLIFIGICIFQLLMAIMAIIEFANILSGIIMILGCCAALFAFKEDMNVTYICWWGVFCFAGFVAGMVGAFMGFAVKISTIVIKFNIPLSCFFGMILAWFIYQDYEQEHPDSNDMVASWLRAFGILRPKAPAANQSNPLLSKGQLPNFGAFDSINGQQGEMNNIAALYPPGPQRDAAIAQAQQQANQYGAMAQDQAEKGRSFAGGWFSKGKDKAAAAQAQAQAQAQQGSGVFATLPLSAPTATGPRDVRRDPFLTQ